MWRRQTGNDSPDKERRVIYTYAHKDLTDMFTNIKAVLPERIEAIGLKNKLSEKDICKAAETLIKQYLKKEKQYIYSFEVKAFKKGTLFVQAENSQWGARLYLLSSELKDKLNQAFPKTKISYIKITVGDISKPSPLKHSRLGRRP